MVCGTKLPLYCPELRMLWGSASPTSTVQDTFPFICLIFSFRREEQASIFLIFSKLWNVFPIISLSSTQNARWGHECTRGMPVGTLYFFHVLIEGVINGWLSWILNFKSNLSLHKLETMVPALHNYVPFSSLYIYHSILIFLVLLAINLISFLQCPSVIINCSHRKKETS